MQLTALKFPVKVSLALVKLAQKLNEHYQAISEVRDGLIKTYGEEDPDNPRQTKVRTHIEKLDDKGETIMEDGELVMEPNPNFPKFAEELTELMAQEVEVVIDVVTLPEKVAATCDKCSHNMERSLEIEPAILMPLVKFIRVA